MKHHPNYFLVFYKIKILDFYKRRYISDLKKRFFYKEREIKNKDSQA
ncbi:hypothetical Protein YC6258_04976 [Gynuella sunshinyii YC6258]|uniref:Uncharacterized protein n=1 Tax=Gynuella sunshinyii YC6258 TaxID=1445510 RepID=A0A0C5VUM7_9GAMM|nr:hypothetical Protein YC6258_04976 [Gynuella sunshinyii YC6258]